MKPNYIIVAFLCMLLGTGFVASAEVTGPGALNRSDQLRSLYAGSISFTENNVPLLRLRVTESDKKITINFQHGLDLLPDGPAGPRIKLHDKGTVEIGIHDAVPAKLSYRVRLEKIRAGNFQQTIARKKWWASKGYTVETVDTGSIFGFHGTVLDNREIRLVTYPKNPTKRAAKALAQKIHDATGAHTIVESWITKLPSGTVKISVPERNLEVTAKNFFWIEAPNGNQVTIENVSFLHQTRGKRGKEHRELSGTFYAVPNPKGQLTLVQVVEAEKLLKGIVPAEIYPSAPKAALQAQAITARGDLLEKLGKRHLNDPFLLCNEVHCQAHRGEALEANSTSQAVDDTRGKVLFHNGHIVPALYHASCGGHTERNEDVWLGAAPHPALRGVKDVPTSLKKPRSKAEPKAKITDADVTKLLEKPSDAFCSLPTKGKASFRWLRPLSMKDLQRVDPKKSLGDIVDIKVTKRGHGGHAMSVQLIGTEGMMDIKPELTIRRTLGGARALRSSLFVLKPQRNPDGSLKGVHVLGGGFGHGVGMCQNGAVGMAQKKRTTSEILQHYFHGTKIHRIY